LTGIGHLSVFQLPNGAFRSGKGDRAANTAKFSGAELETLAAEAALLAFDLIHFN
jgi:hypothetical protein